MKIHNNKTWLTEGVARPDILRKIEGIVGPSNVSIDPADCLCQAYDATRMEAIPDVVIWPHTAHEISRIMFLANEYHIPVTPRGAGTGFSGGALPLHGGVVINLTRMNRILSIDPENMLAEVEPGVVTKELDKAAAEHGLMYPPDPASYEFSTIGGNVAESAGGPRAVKYGVTRDYVLGLEAVLPTGEIIVTGSRTTKCVVGYDLTRLLVGSEGTLAIFTKLFLRLVPKPENQMTLMIMYPTIGSAARSVSRIIASKIIPSTIEFMDKSTLACIREQSSIPFGPEVEALLIIELDGHRDMIQREAEQISSIVNKEGALTIRTAETDGERDEIWATRRAVSPALHKLGPDKYNEDIVVPRSKVPEILVRIEEIGRRYGLSIITFGHAGDGNIHVNIMTDKKIPGIEETVHHALTEIFSATLRLGGSISGEHGIGIAKAPFIGMEMNPATILTMKRIKKALDPQNILNPGKLELY